MNPDAPRLRRLDPNDDAVAALVISIQRRAYRLEADLIGFDGIPGLQENIVDLQRRHDLIWLGSHERERLVGVMAWTIDGKDCDIDRLAVDPNFHRRGHARSLIGSLTGFDRITVSTGAANLPAIRLYESLGFHIVGPEQRDGVTIVHLERIE